MNKKEIEQLKKDMKDIRGMEFTYKFDPNISVLLRNKEVSAYVVDADYDIGITIAAKLPSKEAYKAFGEEFGAYIIVECITYTPTAIKTYIEIVKKTVNGIKEGYFYSDTDGRYIETYDDMSDECPFR